MEKIVPSQKESKSIEKAESNKKIIKIEQKEPSKELKLDTSKPEAKPDPDFKFQPTKSPSKTGKEILKL